MKSILNFVIFLAYGRGQDDVDSEEWETYIEMIDHSEGDSRTIDQTSEQGELDKDELMSESSDID